MISIFFNFLILAVNSMTPDNACFEQATEELCAIYYAHDLIYCERHLSPFYSHVS